MASAQNGIKVGRGLGANMLTAKSMSPMDDLTAQLEALLLRHARWVDHSGPAAFERSLGQFRKDMRRLIAEFGEAAVDAALDGMPDEPWPSVSLH
jgi:hypothetical protein